MILHPETDGAVVFHNRHNLLSTSWRYYTESFRWSAEEILRVRSLETDEPNYTEDEFCGFCTNLIELSEYESFSHQPGYAALYASSASCPMCTALYNSLEQVIKEITTHWARRTKSDDAAPPVKEISDSIVLESMKPPGSVDRVFDRFVVVWRGGDHFQWSGEIVGLCKRIDDGSKYRIWDRPIWTSSHENHFNSRVATIIDWDTECKNNGTCLKEQSPVLPTRVLDVNPSDGSGRPRLICSNGLKAPYAALSYCWGSVVPLTTTKSMIAARMHQSGIGMEELPKTFRDAVEMTRQFNLRYLWIDSLCIVQDDLKDWEAEASQMASIYFNAYITFAAAAAPDCNGGLKYPFVPATCGKYKEYTLCLRMAHTHSRERPTPLSLRGWTLQEELLSRRILSFGERQLHWKCGCTSASEDGLLDDNKDKLAPFTSTLSYYDLNTTDYTSLTKMYEFWRRVAENYSGRELRFAHDKLAAFAGLTKRFEDLTGDTPLLGLWQKHFVQGLLWKAEIGSFRDLALNVPTWSWLSMGGRIQYDNMWLKTIGISVSHYVEPKATLLSSSLLWAGLPMTSRIQMSALSLRACILETRLESSEDPQTPKIRGSIRDDAILSEIVLDEEIQLPVAVCCLWLGIIQSSEGRLYCDHIILVLVPVVGKSDSYRRVGIGVMGLKNDSNGLFDLASERTVSLV